MVTTTASGLVHWPLARLPGTTRSLRLGPPRPLARPYVWCGDHSRDGQVVVAAARVAGQPLHLTGGWVFRADRPGVPVRLDPGKDLRDIAVSPDGRWAATGPHLTGRIKIWDARDGRPEKELPDWSGCIPRFSRDGCWLIASGEAGGLYAVGTWEPGLRFSGRGEMAPDGRLLAVAGDAGVVRLLAVPDGRELARLEGPSQAAHVCMLFTADGTRLVTLANGKGGGLRAWDLRALRRQLRELGLDWEAPDYPPAPLVPPLPLLLEVVAGPAPG